MKVKTQKSDVAAESKLSAEPDRSRINLSEPYEISFWTATLNCSRVKLHQAVNAVGNSPASVQGWLRENR